MEVQVVQLVAVHDALIQSKSSRDAAICTIQLGDVYFEAGDGNVTTHSWRARRANCVDDASVAAGRGISTGAVDVGRSNIDGYIGDSDARKKDPEKLRKRDMERYEKDREKRIALATEHSHLRKARKKNTKTERGISKLALKKKFGTKCYYCEKDMDFSVGAGRKFNRDMATIEHLIPLARGGEHTFENTVLACRHCNISKNAKSEEEFEIYKNI